MKTRYIKHWMLLPVIAAAALLSTACSNETLTTAPESQSQKGYEIPVTVNVTRDNSALTRTSYDAQTQKVSFTEGDRLFVEGVYEGENKFHGTLAYDATNKTFCGKLTADYAVMVSDADAFLSGAQSVSATLLPNGCGDYEYIGLLNENYVQVENTKAITCGIDLLGAAIAQFAHETASTYSGGFALKPQNAIFDCTFNNFNQGNVFGSSEANVGVTISYTTGGENQKITYSAGNTSNKIYLALPASTEGMDVTNFSIKLDNGSIATTFALADATIKSGQVYTITKTIHLAGEISFSGESFSYTYIENKTFQNKVNITGDGEVTYSSSDTNVATVDETGTVTMKGPGECTITATVADGTVYTYATKQASYTLTLTTTHPEGAAGATADNVWDEEDLNEDQQASING